MPQTLFDISDDMAALEELLSDADANFDDPKIQETLCAWAAKLSENFEVKIDNYAALIKTFEARAAVRREEIRRLSARVKADEGAAAGLKARLLEVFQKRDIKKLETPRFLVSRAKNGGLQALDVAVPPERLPETFQRVVIMADNDKLRKALDAGEKIPGCQLLPRGEGIRIR